jgi:hypothetical protein
MEDEDDEDDGYDDEDDGYDDNDESNCDLRFCFLSGVTKDCGGCWAA